MPEDHSDIIPSRHGQCDIHGPQFPNVLNLARLLKMNPGRKFQLWNGLGPLVDIHRDLSTATKILGLHWNLGLHEVWDVWVGWDHGQCPTESHRHLLLSHLHLLHHLVDLLELDVQVVLVQVEHCDHRILDVQGKVLERGLEQVLREPWQPQAGKSSSRPVLHTAGRRDHLQRLDVLVELCDTHPGVPVPTTNECSLWFASSRLGQQPPYP